MRFLILLGLVIVLTSALDEERELSGLEENQIVDADRRMTRPAICKDNFRRCKILKRRGGCRRYRFWMKKNCMASCKYCNKGSQRPKSTSYTCKDKMPRRFCKFQKRRGNCRRFKAWMKRKCKSTCGLC